MILSDWCHFCYFTFPLFTVRVPLLVKVVYFCVMYMCLPIIWWLSNIGLCDCLVKLDVVVICMVFYHVSCIPVGADVCWEFDLWMVSTSRQHSTPIVDFRTILQVWCENLKCELHVALTFCGLIRLVDTLLHRFIFGLIIVHQWSVFRFALWIDVIFTGLLPYTLGLCLCRDNAYIPGPTFGFFVNPGVRMPGSPSRVGLSFG